MIRIIDFGSRKTGAIADVIAALGYECSVLKDAEMEESQLLEASGIILSGAPVLLTETDPHFYIERYSFLRTADVPVLGICFGHQLLGLLHGASVFKGKEVRSETMITIDQHNDLFSGFPGTALFTEDHTEGITLPEGFIRLAHSELYEVEAMKHERKAMFGLQFHPEVSGESGKRVIENFFKYG